MLPVQIPELCFSTVLTRILECGVTKAHLARTLNVPFTTLNGWVNGSRPSWHHGQAILAIQKQLAESRDSVTHAAQV